MKYSFAKIAGAFFILLNQYATSQVINLFAGDGTPGFSGDSGQAVLCQLYGAMGTAIDANGNVVIADRVNSRIRKVTTTGIISTIAGGGGSTADGIPATDAALGAPYNLEFDATGNLYIADDGIHKVRTINSSGIITTLAGNGIAGFSGDGGMATAAKLNEPQHAVPDGLGNIYIADTYNHRIRKVNSSGTITTIAGNGNASSAGDGSLAVNASLDYPACVALDPAGNIYIAEGLRVRKINSSGIITTVAGGGTSTLTGIPATSKALGSIRGIAFDPLGNLFIADYGFDCVYRVNSSGIITKIAGTGVMGYSGNGGPALNADMMSINDLSFDTAGNLYTAENFNSVVRVISSIPNAIKESTTFEMSFKVSPNPTSGKIIISAEVNEPMAFKMTNSLGEDVYDTSFFQQITLDANDFKPGIYFVTVAGQNKKSTKKLVVTR